MLFHAFPGGIFKSGFTGVDIFFVISGFLISSILFRGMDERSSPTGQGRPFSFWDFYSRRVRRIFPSLIFCLLTFLVLGWLYMLPDEYSLLGKHAMGAAGYVSNLVLWSEAGDYFQTSSQTKPLLHLWSLGIEEQYYLVWPALLFIMWKLRLNVFTFALLGAAASLGFEIHAVRSDPSAAFYSPMLRFWELMAGSLLAWLKLYKSESLKAFAGKAGPVIGKIVFASVARRDPVRTCANALSFLGLALILVAIFGLNAKHFPGSKALYPVLGAVFMIAAGRDAFFNRVLLSNRVMVWLGLISYPLYIWHWPFLSFCWIFSASLPDLKVRICCVAVSVAMAAITYYVVEPHLRWGRYTNAKAISLLCTMLAVGFCGYEVWHHNGYPNRIKDSNLADVDEIESTFKNDVSRCERQIPDWIKLLPQDKQTITTCKLTKESGKNDIAIIGDSHAGQLYYGFVKNGINVAVFPANCAIPLIGLHSQFSQHGTFYQFTEHLMSEAFSYILEHKNLKKVLLVHRPGCSYTDLHDLAKPNENNHDTILYNGFRRTFKELQDAGREIYVVFDNPVYKNEQFEACKGLSYLNKRPRDLRGFFISSKKNLYCHISDEKRDEKDAYENYKRIAKDASKGFARIKFIDLSQYFCKDGTCSMLDEDGKLLYRDREHLNFQGSFFRFKKNNYGDQIRMIVTSP